MADTSTAQSTRSRLEEIEKEMKSLREKQTGLKKRWQQEKDYITQIRRYKAEIEEARNQAKEYERNGQLEKVAEMRYGRIPELEKRLRESNDQLAELQKSGAMLKEEIDAEDIAEIVAKWTGIPVQRMLETERTKLLHMEDRIHKRLIDQNDAVHSVSNAIRRSRAGLQDIDRPIGSFIFLGSTGVGKTEMARALAEFLFDDENNIVRLDMSEYMEKYSVSRLIGAPPGYVGYEEGGQLTEAVRRNPYSVVLLDEIEKANPEVFNVLLQVLDEGRLTDGKGRTVNFRNTIIIMTSNLGSELIQDSIADMDGKNSDEVFEGVRSRIIDLLRKKMRPEFLNRIDEIILFKPLMSKEIRQIADLQLKRLRMKLAAKNIGMEISGEALDWLAKIGYDVQYGARPLKRAIQKHIGDQLAVRLLSGEFAAGDNIRIDVSDAGGFTFTKA
ncbi:MAG: AAA family ATPase [Candidatus Kapaibacterium sp.]